MAVPTATAIGKDGSVVITVVGRLIAMVICIITYYGWLPSLSYTILK